ncbi:anti-sigma factor family protein [Sphingomonas quercus]|uniref:Zf-HC2 domain-containing protein n=1 Tax=Sphingomonas quercus TaxID=2842451 RepID=A0ABS6BKJ0_9SPHN|nr:zf-HC2 domain-containing protein [Sphingomonas quercus]MBU3078809.1 zf-HC2 domain-containing protein [Sphingomonas quercus]
MHDPVTELDIQAYLDGELDLPRRLAVEDHLAGDPAAAARYMAELRAQTALRLLAEPRDPAPAALIAAAGRLAARMAPPPRPLRHRTFGGMAVGGLAAIAATLLVFVVPGVSPAAPPSYVGDAVMAYRTGLLRAELRSQLESPHFDAGEIQRSTHIRVPRLPRGWQITDAQIFPSDEGPALQLMIRTPAGKNLSVFAVRARSAAPRSPLAMRHDNASVAYWRAGDMSYALIGMEAPEALDLAAENLATEGVF